MGVLAAGGIAADRNNNTQVVAAIRRLVQTKTVLVDVGTANAYAASNAPALTALPASGFVQVVSIANANTGAATYAPDGLAAKPILGMANAQLQGGELPAKGVATLVYVVASNLNSGNGAWVLIECTGGAQQLGAGSYGSTPPQFDNSAKFATTAGVKSAGFRHAASVPLSAATTLDASYAGKIVVLGGAGGYTITLPARSALPDGESITFICTASAAVTIQRAVPDQIYPNSASITSLSMSNGATAVLESSNAVSGWALIDGSSQLVYGGMMGASIAPNGYTKLPNGLIIQWTGSSYSFPGSGQQTLDINFPIAFPNGVLSVIVGNGENSTSQNDGVVQWNPIATTTAKFRVYCYSAIAEFTGFTAIAIGY
ncbi:gp53-like domain-containing protein [Pandoraea apista]|uniref:Putative tail fiber protein gp53-like C-terminal domain-containing protein n=2 Tax=Pandoraea apista TaxID=93218 RepID=A0ABX9ZJK0_9BURK|nr:hypothetical protein [Pandoraea apista]PTE00887.1 hypothetical protein C7830_11675 [Pandoraea apista]RRJ30849.1 hypothetical protein EIB05_13805 [Pandoraea apista]RRJ74524.1 hypothetical protein EIL82_14800 [Pandoraea apista]RSD06710.1 hypothetical protein EJB12_20425 [Pandoraea apista]RSD14593.1 hypothetical protein EIZ52_18350 [Pandoraea apista]